MMVLVLALLPPPPLACKNLLIQAGGISGFRQGQDDLTGYISGLKSIGLRLSDRSAHVTMKQNPFLQKKSAILKELEAATKDALPKGTVDLLCWPLINLINSSKTMVTTSSCSGRVSVFLEGVKLGKPGGKGDGGKWLFITHDVNELDLWYKKTFKDENSEYVSSQEIRAWLGRLVLFKFEPVIYHIQCETPEQASELYQTAMSCGFRESGIGKNNNVALRVLIRIDTPIGVFDEGKIKLFVDENVLELLTNLSKEKFASNQKKTDELYHAIERMIASLETEEVVKTETKEERRERKRREGLKKQAEKAAASLASEIDDVTI